jgi:hypothetical protein
VATCDDQTCEAEYHRRSCVSGDFGIRAGTLQLRSAHCSCASDRFGSRPFAVGGLVPMAMTFVVLTLIPVNFDYRI